MTRRKIKKFVKSTPPLSGLAVVKWNSALNHCFPLCPDGSYQWTRGFEIEDSFPVAILRIAPANDRGFIFVDYRYRSWLQSA
jgi:hypothetical protein